MEIKWEIKTYLFCSVLESDAEQREMLFYDAKTMLEKMVQCSPALLFGRGPNRVIEMTCFDTKLQ